MNLETDLKTWTTAAIIGAVLIGIVRLVLWQRTAPEELGSPAWRLALLIALQPAAGILLHFLLFPSPVATRSGSLIVATRGAPLQLVRQPGDMVVALPEAGAVAGATPVPDLGSAVRTFPGASTIRVVGGGLSPRDQLPLPLPLVFEPPPLPRGLTEVFFPSGPLAPGEKFRVGGRLGTLRQGTVELLDPAGAVADRLPISSPEQRFALASFTRAPGLALFTLRARTPSGAVVDQIAVPIEASVQPVPRVLVLAGAPSPEIKYLRRWAEDSGIELSIQLDVGAGLALGDKTVALTGATLAATDLVVIDDRRWSALARGERAALISAVDGGLGLLLRPTGPLDPGTRRDWAALGIPLTAGDDIRPVRLSPASRPASVAPKAREAETLPELSRHDVTTQGRRAISLIRDSDGLAIASWSARGLGRVGVWTVADSYVLVLSGHSDRHGELWSGIFSALARGTDSSRATVEGIARAGERLALCRLIGTAVVIEPGARERSLRVDPATGEKACAAYWPERSGWHLARDGKGRETPFFVHPAGSTPSLVAAANREATLAMAGRAAVSGPASPAPGAPGSPWPAFTALLAVLALLWWLERHGRGRRVTG